LLANRTEFWPTRLALESDATLIDILTTKMYVMYGDKTREMSFTR